MHPVFRSPFEGITPYVVVDLLCQWENVNLGSDFPGGSDGKASVYNVGDPGSIRGLGRSLEKEMAIHPRTIAWKIPWTEEPGRLQPMGSQRVGHD